MVCWTWNGAEPSRQLVEEHCPIWILAPAQINQHSFPMLVGSPMTFEGPSIASCSGYDLSTCDIDIIIIYRFGADNVQLGLGHWAGYYCQCKWYKIFMVVTTAFVQIWTTAFFIMFYLGIADSSTPIAASTSHRSYFLHTLLLRRFIRVVQMFLHLHPLDLQKLWSEHWSWNQSSHLSQWQCRRTVSICVGWCSVSSVVGVSSR